LQALILAGGQGTRLRPLTLTVAKPVVPILDRPHLVYMAEWLRQFGVEEIILACGHMSAGIKSIAGDGTSLGVRLRYVEEPEARGTGGAIKEAEALLEDRFLVLNGDILCDLDLAPQIEHHERTGASATIGVIEVEDPSAFGVVVADDEGAVEAFVEKPKRKDAPSKLVNAGVYVLEKSVLDGIPAEQNVSIEREVFPALVGKGLHALEIHGRWIDIGTPDRYLEAHWDLLEGRMKGGPDPSDAEDGVTLGFDCKVNGEVEGPAWLDDEVEVAAGAKLGPRVSIGAGTTVAKGAEVSDSVLLAGVKVANGAKINGAIIARGATIGKGAVVGPDAVIGEGATVAPGTVLEPGARIAPELEEDQ